jgi:hypothetical protein
MCFTTRDKWINQSASALKKEMIDWLERHGVQYDTSARKAMLYTIIHSIKPKGKDLQSG